jgi:hypothetical protein
MKDIAVIVFALSHNVFLFMLPLFSSTSTPKESKDHVEGAFTPWLNELLNHARLETNYSTPSHCVEHTAQLPIPATIPKP